jgi:hypothetical protein
MANQRLAITMITKDAMRSEMNKFFAVQEVKREIIAAIEQAIDAIKYGEKIGIEEQYKRGILNSNTDLEWYVE